MPILLYKKIGETPLEAIKRLRFEDPKLENDRLSYAGRLDPLAEGLLLILVGDECSEERRQSFLGLEKDYEIGVLFGISTDSFDLLGLPNTGDVLEIQKSSNLNNLRASVEKILTEFIGAGHGLTYPPFSSKTIGGKSLFELAKSKEGVPKELPKTKGQITGIKITGFRNISTSDLKDHIHKIVDIVRGDFRQKDILEVWDRHLKALPKDLVWPILALSVQCESGVYMRSLAESIGKKLGTGALAFSIKRTRIGKYLLG